MLWINAILLHSFDPIAIQLGPISIRWYSLAYIVGIIAALWLISRLNQRLKQVVFVNNEQIYDSLLWVVFGIIIGGRLGYIIFYYTASVQKDWLSAVRIWDGGMSFHGGLVGLVIGLWLYSRRANINFLRVCDLASCASPIGLFLGRVANFINGELYGKPTDLPWAVVFPMVDHQPRHPSQLYEAVLEGILLLCIMLLSFWSEAIRNTPGRLSGLFLVSYASIRITVEHFFREPDMQLGLFYGILSMGQILSLPMLLVGIYLLVRPISRIMQLRGECDIR
ncbi:MAG: prolipoprotein diacylglyceryl transferase [Proteobacteria bacterium]|nr:prolipoprotein diacylglyceryl transferase [Pseudomonadota bacterium]